MKIRQKEQQNERCAVCRDGEGLVVCRGCGTLIHASCLLDVNGCPTLGCNELDPLQPKPSLERHVLNVLNDSPRIQYLDGKTYIDTGNEIVEVTPGRQVSDIDELAWLELISPEPGGDRARVRRAMEHAKAELEQTKVELDRFRKAVLFEDDPSSYREQTVDAFKSRAARAKKVRAAQSESYQRSLAEALEEEEYQNELIVCWTQRCIEPVKRQDRFCDLCTAETDVGVETGAGETREEREVVLENADLFIASEKKFGLGVLWFFLSCAIAVCLMGIMDWLRS